ncbi:MAG: Protein RecA [candidate division TM6 bacterium GW2011_GWF2_28_16]|jgi:recombination protein RecA|nr:MAG: Protein RecA [candidate division TM6 bacterium GW2011_GWF2_28_16]
MQVKKVSASNAELEAKHKALDAAFAQIDKQFGKGAVMLLGQKTVDGVQTISTGSILIDKALGIGGLPRGRVIEIYGPEASGKTTLTLHAIAQAQKAGGICAFIDAEHAMDPIYAENIGVNTKDLVISQPDYGEQALDIAEMLIRSGAIDLLVIDSVAALVPKAEIEGDMGDQHIGLQARLMSQALRKLTPIVHKSKTSLIFINQIRHKIGGMPFANNETTSGGNALKFYASIRLDIRRIATLKKDGKPFGNKVAVKVAKNKMAPPFKVVEVDIIFGHGISKDLDLLEIAIKLGIIKQAGAWFVYKEEKLGQGRDNCIKTFTDNPALAEKILEDVMKNQDVIE